MNSPQEQPEQTPPTRPAYPTRRPEPTSPAPPPRPTRTPTRIATSPEQRSLAARIAVHASWANTTDRTARTAPGTKAFLDRFERQVDPDGQLPPDERARRAEHARKAYFLGLALKSAKARAKRKAS